MVRGKYRGDSKLINPKCLSCMRKCKQKAYVKIVKCPLFLPKEVKDGNS